MVKCAPLNCFFVEEYNCSWWFQIRPTCGGTLVKHTRQLVFQCIFLLAETLDLLGQAFSAGIKSRFPANSQLSARCFLSMEPEIKLK